MKIEVVHSDWTRLKCDALLIPMFEEDPLEEGFCAQLDMHLGGLLAELRNSEEWKAKTGEVRILHRPPGLAAARLVLLGAGESAHYNSSAIRRLLMEALGRVKSFNLKRVAVYRRSRIPLPLAAQAAVEGVILATYAPDDYKTRDRTRNLIQEIVLLTDGSDHDPDIEAHLRRGEILAQATNQARRLVNEPGNRISPTGLAQAARETAEKYGLEIEVWGEPEMEKQGMGALLAVARGSDEAARFIILRHLGAPHPEDSPMVLVGKGVTFDSGGLSLKPARSMEEMKADKAGACAVLAAMGAIARLEVPRNVVGLLAAVENLPSGRAQRPGDVIRSMSGKTIEVLNTDAEGRLILADALHYGTLLNPCAMVDLATLTGACVVALGHIRAGLFSNDEELCCRLLEAGERAGEKFWRLPLDREYRQELDSYIADLKNVGGRWGGAVTAAKFLEEFVGETPWCHLDIAGVDLFPEDNQVKGPTGFGVRTLVELVAGPVPIR